MKKRLLILCGILFLIVGCTQKKPMQVTFVDNPEVCVGDVYDLQDFVVAVENGELFYKEIGYIATRPGVYVYELEGEDRLGKTQTFTLEVKALERQAAVVQTYNVEIVEVGIEGFPINHDLLDSDVNEELKAEGAYFGELEPTVFDHMSYYQLPYFNFLFSVSERIDQRMKLYVRFIDETDTAYFGLYVPDDQSAESMQFVNSIPIEEFVVMTHEAKPEEKVGAFVMRMGDNYVYYALESEQKDLDEERQAMIERMKGYRPYITIYGR